MATTRPRIATPNLFDVLATLDAKKHSESSSTAFSSGVDNDGVESPRTMRRRNTNTQRRSKSESAAEKDANMVRADSKELEEDMGIVGNNKNAVLDDDDQEVQYKSAAEEDQEYAAAAAALSSIARDLHTDLSTNSTIATTMLTDEDEDEEELESALMYDPTSLSTADQFMAAMTTSTTPPRVMLVMHAGFAMLLAVLLALGIYTFGDTGNVYVWALLVINSALWFAVTSLAMSIGDGATTTGDGDDQEDEEPMTMSDEGQSLLDMGF